MYGFKLLTLWGYFTWTYKLVVEMKQSLVGAAMAVSLTFSFATVLLVFSIVFFTDISNAWSCGFTH